MSALPDHISVQFQTNTSAPTPPSFTPNDRYVTPGDCPSKGHVYVFSSVQQNWRCASCQHVAPAGRPAPSVPAPAYPAPEPITIPPLTTDPKPDWYGTTPWQTLPSVPCAFDNLPPDMRGKPLLLSCQCPKCSPWC